MYFWGYLSFLLGEFVTINLKIKNLIAILKLFIMKKVLSLLAFLLIANVCMYAQDLVKETVIVDRFISTTDHVLALETTHALRDMALQAFTEKGRFNIVDSEQNAVLQKLNSTRKQYSEESVNASNVLDDESTEVYKSLGAKYLVQGRLTNLSVSYVETTNSSPYYRGEVTLVLSVHNIADGSVKASETLEFIGIDSEVAKQSVDDAVKSTKSKIMAYVDRHFTFITRIEQIEVMSKKGVAKELYIAGGTEMGVQKGQTFIVRVLKQIGSRTTLIEIGKLKAKEVLDGVTLCTVSKGGEEISQIFKNTGNFSTLVIESDKLSAGAAFVGGLKEFFQ
jgi:hypothetical protein